MEERCLVATSCPRAEDEEGSMRTAAAALLVLVMGLVSAGRGNR